MQTLIDGLTHQLSHAPTDQHISCLLRSNGPRCCSGCSGDRRLSLWASLLLEVLDGGLDGVFGQHAAVELHGRQLQVAGDVRVLDGQALVDGLPKDPLGGHGAARARDGSEGESG